MKGSHLVEVLIVKYKTKNLLPSIFDYYIQFSFWSSFLLFMTFHFVHEWPVIDQFYMSTLMVMNFYYYNNCAGKSLLLKNNNLVPAYFLAQTLLLIGNSFTHQIMGSTYLALIPCAAGTYYFTSKDKVARVEDLYKGINLFLIATSSYTLFSIYTKQILLNSVELIYLLGFVLWSSCTIFYGVRITFKEHKVHLIQLLKRSKNKKTFDQDEDKDKYFFHDLINITHGINLFLESRISTENNISTNDAKNIKHEIKSLETMIQNHFEYQHKDLIDVQEIITFTEAKVNLYQTIQTYLPSDLVECHFIYNGFLSADSSNYQKELALIHLPSFTRIMGNIVKNMSEVDTTQAEFIFNYDLRGLHVITKNKIYKLKDDRLNLAEKMKDLILDQQYNSKNTIEGLGLKSIQSQVKSIGGNFRFKIENGFWISELFIPRILNNEEQTASAA
jgi:hypothetical protein